MCRPTPCFTAHATPPWLACADVAQMAHTGGVTRLRARSVVTRQPRPGVGRKSLWTCGGGHERRVALGPVQPASPQACLEALVVRFSRCTASMNREAHGRCGEATRAV